MTPDERKLLNDLADNVAQAPAPQRDAEAEEIIRTRIGKRPDALYLMTQTVLIQNMALQRTQQQLRDLQARGPQGAGSGGFLGQPGAAGGYGGQQQYSAPQQAPQYAAPASAPAASGGGGFLRGAAQTAAGVAAGTLAAEAIGSMFSHGGGGMFGGGPGLFGGGDAPREEIVNNYYDSPQGGDYQAGDAGGNQFRDPGDTNVGDDSSTYDDNSVADDASLDDGGGIDNSGDDSMFS